MPYEFQYYSSKSNRVPPGRPPLPVPVSMNPKPPQVITANNDFVGVEEGPGDSVGPKVPVLAASTSSNAAATTATAAATGPRWGRGTFTRHLLSSAAQSKDSSLSPGTIQMLVNPMRMHFGLPSLSLESIAAEERTLKEAAGDSTKENMEPIIRALDTIKDESGVSSDHLDLDEVVEDKKRAREAYQVPQTPAKNPMNEMLNDSFMDSLPYDSFNISKNNQTGGGGPLMDVSNSSYAIPSQIQEDTRSFLQRPSARENNNSIWTKPRDDRCNESMNDSQDSFMISRSSKTVGSSYQPNDSIGFTGLNNEFARMSMVAAERSRCAVSPTSDFRFMTANLPALSELHSTKSPTRILNDLNYDQDEDDDAYSFLSRNHQQDSPGYTGGIMEALEPEQHPLASSKHPAYAPSNPYEGQSSSSRASGSTHPRVPVKQDEQRQFGRCLEQTPAVGATKDVSKPLRLPTENQDMMCPPAARTSASSVTATGRNSCGGSSNNHNTNNSLSSIPEMAAIIPSGKVNSGGKTFNGTPINSNNGPGNRGGKSTKKMSGSESSSKRKKTGGGGSGWKFNSEHVRDTEYLVIKVLGKGGCGEVSLVIEKETRQLYALKRVTLAGIDQMSVQDCINEVTMLESLKDSDLVVQIHSWEFSQVEKTMKIVMEYGQCDLNTSIASIRKCVLKLKFVWKKMLMIVDTIHKRGIVHGDLKPANFIWAGDNLKIIDFGIASKLQQDHTSIAVANTKGTINFMSPESISGDTSGRAKVSPKLDIWSLGCILYLMIYGKTPFEHIPCMQRKMAAILRGEIEYPQVPMSLSTHADELIATLRACFNMEYRSRPTAEELLRDRLLR